MTIFSPLKRRMGCVMNKKTSEVIRKVHEFFKEKRLTLSVAESCTGGLVSHFLTTLPGASTFFEAGVVAYSIEFKKRILGVSSETITKELRLKGNREENKEDASLAALRFLIEIVEE